MKKHNIVIAISFAALFLTACGAKEMTKEGATYVIKDKDNEIFESATARLDKSACNDITQAALKNDCNNIVESKLLIQNALQESDTSLCKKITIMEYQELCVRQVEAYVDEEQALEKKRAKEDEERKKNEKKWAEIMDARDISRCKEFEDPERRSECEAILKEAVR